MGLSSRFPSVFQACSLLTPSVLAGELEVASFLLLGVVARACSLNTWDAEAGGLPVA